MSLCSDIFGVKSGLEDFNIKIQRTLMRDFPRSFDTCDWSREAVRAAPHSL